MTRRLGPALVLAGFPALVNAQPPRAGSEFIVNTYTTSNQNSPVVAADASGRFVVIWEAYGLDGSDGGLFGQRYDAAGRAVGGEFQVNTYTADRQFDAQVAAGPTGDFMVVWTSAGGETGPRLTVKARRYEAGGNAIGGEIIVATATTDQFAPSVAIDAGGNAIVAWQRVDGDGFLSGVVGQRFDTAGSPLGGEFAVNVYTTYGQGAPSVAAHPDGSFVVAWSSVGQDGNGRGVFARRFDAGGTPLAEEFAVNTFTTLDQHFPRVASRGTGRFAVVWMSTNQDGDGEGAFARMYDATGDALGVEFQVNTFTTGRQQRPEIAGDGAGGFIVVWESWDQDGSVIGPFGRVFDAAGVASQEFQIHTHTTGQQRLPTVTADADGRFVVAWYASPGDGSGYGVRAQRFGDLIFKDGVESGDLSRWSTAATGGGDLTASGAAALAGTTVGLRANVNDTAGLFVHDDSPTDEGRYRARFYFDPNGFDPGESQLHRRTRIFIAFSESPSRRVAAVVLRRLSGVYAVMGRGRRDDNSQANTGFVTITDGPHAIEIELVRASSPGALDGEFELWVDGVSAGRLTGLDNSLSEVDFARLGALSVKTGASGVLYFDEFESRRESAIGLLP
jgi:hypothetical protein